MGASQAAEKTGMEPAVHNRYFNDFATALRYWRDKRG